MKYFALGVVATIAVQYAWEYRAELKEQAARLWSKVRAR